MQASFGRETDLKFIVKGIKEICAIEGEEADSEQRLGKITLGAIAKKQILILRKGNEPTAFLQFQFSTKCPFGLDYGATGKKYCWVDWMYVAKEHRRAGLGKALFAALRKVCKQKKAYSILLDVYHVNAKARKFYEKTGFTEHVHILKSKVK